MSNDGKSVSKIIAQGSKSFAFASKLLGPEVRDSALRLYAWCRYCDDMIDEAPSREMAMERIIRLRQDLDLATRTNQVLQDPFEYFRLVCRRHQLSEKAARDLLNGFALDVECKWPTNESELEYYCYCVAGTVGIMMAQIMGARDIQALNCADQLGRAMQMTNIARDVFEDFQQGRQYLPREWMGTIALADFETDSRQKVLFLNIEKLLRLAEDRYHAGLIGLDYLPFRSALSIATAALVYRQIGLKILKLGSGSLKIRVSTNLGEKILCALQATKLLILQRFFKVKSFSLSIT